MLIVNELTFISGNKKILNDVSFSVNKEKKIIIGDNGEGKTTLLEVICGSLQPDSGEIIKKGKIAYVPQEVEALETTGEMEIEKAFSEVKEIEKALTNLEAKGNFGEEYGTLLQRYEHLGGYTYKQEIEMMLEQIGLKKDTLKREMKELSGGERTKIEIAKALLSKADILLLDEPTNHLDIETIELLESLLKKFKGDLLVVSHDRTFIDNIATHILYLSNGKIREYGGDYEKFVALRKAEDEKIAKEREKLIKYIEKERAFIEKFRYGTRSAQAKSREKKIAKIEVPEIEKKHKINLHLESAERGSTIVLKAENIKKAYSGKPILNGVNLTIMRKQRIGIVGKNGSGKSTFLKIIAGVEKPDSGTIKLGPSIKMAYFPQDAFVMNPNSTLVSQITDYGYTISEARNILALFDFTDDEVFKTVSELSGGEKRRLMLAKISLIKGNFLVLDEPTNHLSIDLKEIVLDALKDYEGTILIVTHDRFVLKRVAEKIYLMENGLLKKKKERKEEPTENKKDSKKEINKLKTRIAYLEKLVSQNRASEKKIKELRILKEKIKQFKNTN
jgi:ATP-binding cassette subfamily F protein 3